MPAIETTLTPINGMEAKQILKDSFESELERVPMLRQGLAYKQIKLYYRMFIEAFPSDCPCPAGEFQLLLGLDEGEDIQFDKDAAKLNILKEKMQTMIENVKRIEKFLIKHSPQYDRIIKLEDEGIPDRLRIDHGLKIPVMMTQNGKTFEKYIDAKDLKVRT